MSQNILLPVQRASDLSTAGAQTQWLVQDLWTDQAVGILGGEPKCCKSFMALDIAVSVASGADCLRRFPTRKTGRVLLFPAEDSLPIVRQRLEGIARVAKVSFPTLPVEVITVPALRLDTPGDRQRLAKTVEHLRPILLILDPLIRLHRVDENDATQIAALLSFLRELQREYQLAVILVHHARKDSNASRPGQALRGSSELHGWGDSNLYMRRKGPQLTLSTEHRAAPSQDHIPLELAEGPGLALRVLDQPRPEPDRAPTPVERVRNTLAQLTEPAPVQHLRKLCGMRTAAVCAALSELAKAGEVIRGSKGYQLNLALFPVSLPMDPQGNGNGKHSLCSSGG